jgi:hypothetical protein
VRAEALARTTDPRALGGIARHAKHEATAAAAVSRLEDRDELIEVAQNAEHKDVALAAFDKLLAPAPDLALLRTIETKTGQKAVAKRARAIIGEAEAAEAARLAAIEDRRKRAALLCDAAERASSLADADAIRAEVARVSTAWTAENVDDAAARERFEAAVARAQATIDAREREAAEAAELARSVPKPSPRARHSASASKRWTATMYWRNLFRSRKSGDHLRHWSGMARRPPAWLSASPVQWLRAGSGTSWVPCWPRHERRTRRWCWKPKACCRPLFRAMQARLWPGGRRSAARRAATHIR